MAAARRVELAGRLDSVSAPDRIRESADWFVADQTTTVDLAAVERVDSAGVALLLEWTRQARSQRAELRFVNAPEQMRAIVDFCALDDVIPMAPAASAGA